MNFVMRDFAYAQRCQKEERIHMREIDRKNTNYGFSSSSVDAQRQ